MSELCCTCTPELLYTDRTPVSESQIRVFLRRMLRVAARHLVNWHTGGRTADLVRALNDQQLRDIGMECEQSHRALDRLERERYLWHRPLL